MIMLGLNEKIFLMGKISFYKMLQVKKIVFFKNFELQLGLINIVNVFFFLILEWVIMRFMIWFLLEMMKGKNLI